MHTNHVGRKGIEEGLTRNSDFCKPMPKQGPNNVQTSKVKLN